MKKLLIIGILLVIPFSLHIILSILGIHLRWRIIDELSVLLFSIMFAIGTIFFLIVIFKRELKGFFSISAMFIIGALGFLSCFAAILFTLNNLIWGIPSLVNGDVDYRLIEQVPDPNHKDCYLEERIHPDFGAMSRMDFDLEYVCYFGPFKRISQDDQMYEITQWQYEVTGRTIYKKQFSFEENGQIHVKLYFDEEDKEYEKSF